MNCRSCGAPLPTGTSFCPTCGAAVPASPSQNTPSAPYSPYGSPPPAQQTPSGPGYAGGYDPTVAAQPYSTPQQPGSGSSGNYDPTIMAQPYNAPQQQPSTAYGGPSNPYDPYSANISAAPPPPPAAYGSYGSQAPISAPGYAPQPGTYSPPVPARKKSNLGLIITLVVLAVVVACGGGTWLVIRAASSTSTTTNNGPSSSATSTTSDATPTVAPTTVPTTAPTTAPSNGVPTQADIVQDAAAFFANAKSASAVNSNYEPTQVASTFQVNQTVYVTFDFNNDNAQTGYIGIRWYLSGHVAVKDQIASVPHSAPGMFSAKFFRAGDVVAGLYWCTKADCSDGQLGAVVNLTVQ